MKIYVVKYEECIGNEYYSGVVGVYKNIENAKTTIKECVEDDIKLRDLSKDDISYERNETIIDIGIDYIVYEIIEKELI